MTGNLMERHFDYVLGPNQDSRLASLDPGAAITAELKMDSDAPFLLRSRALRLRSDGAGKRQTGLNHVLARWSGPNRDFKAQVPVRQSLYSPYFGQIGNPIPVSPEVFYPRQASLFVEIVNDSPDTTLTNLTFYFRGVKLFSPGAVKSYQYPSRFSGLPFIYPLTDKTGTGAPLVHNLVADSGPVRYTFRCKPDADFVLRGGQAGDTFDAAGAVEVFMKLMDEDEKPYSNDFVHMDVLFGNSNFAAAYPAGSSIGVHPIGGGPNLMGLFYPEIYVPANHLLYFDVLRDDAFISGSPVDYPIAFIGQKVFIK